MTAVKVNLPPIEQSATYSHNLYYREPDGTTPIQLYNCTAKMQVRPGAGSSILYIELSTENGRIVIDPLLGKISLIISATDTLAITPIKDALYDLELYFHDTNIIKRLIEGKITVKAGITV